MGNVEYAECYAELANAIVLQAFKDYRKALFKLVQEPEEWKHRSSKKKLERFFHSKWYRTLTDLDPAILMQEAKRQADINVERWERGRARARERAERKAAKKNLSAAAVMLSSFGATRRLRTASARSPSAATIWRCSSLGGSFTIVGLPPVISGTGSFSISAV